MVTKDRLAHGHAAERKIYEYPLFRGLSEIYIPRYLQHSNHTELAG